MSSLEHAHLSRATAAPLAHAQRRVLLLIAGHSGRVGSVLCQLLAAERARLQRDAGISFEVVGLVNRRETVWREPDSAWREDTLPRGGGDWPLLIRRFHTLRGPKLFVDCTAATEVAQHYVEFFMSGIGVVTPNKLANSGTQQRYRALLAKARQHQVPYLYETTVGAALPLLGSLADLRASGDQVQRIEAVLSGTLSFIFQRLNHGTPFSAAVREARDEGYTEPHPAEDLKAADSARKLLILLREAGFEWEPERVTVQGLLPPALAAEANPERFLQQLAAYDEEWSLRTAAAKKRSLRLACLAEFDGRSARVGLTHVAAGDPFAQLAPGENLVRIWTKRYQPVPLSISGPGAGPEITAAGLFTDVIKAGVSPPTA